MRFYDREKELSSLKNIEKRSNTQAQMTLLIGRRRVGKTALVKKAYEKRVYFFVSKKSEAILCEEYVEIIQNSLGVKIFGQIVSFAKLFEYLLEISKSIHFTLIVDEFQEFYQINSGVYSDIQNLWDEYKDSSKINLIFCGSIYSIMTKIFEHSKEPLFGRITNKINLKPFNISTIKQIMQVKQTKKHTNKMTKKTNPK